MDPKESNDIFPDFSQEMERRRAQIRERLGLVRGTAEEACTPAGCASCAPGACSSSPSLGNPLEEAYEVC